jgi:hypothetical protein
MPGIQQRENVKCLSFRSTLSVRGICCVSLQANKQIPRRYSRLGMTRGTLPVAAENTRSLDYALDSSKKRQLRLRLRRNSDLAPLGVRHSVLLQ